MIVPPDCVDERRRVSKDDDDDDDDDDDVWARGVFERDDEETWGWHARDRRFSNRVRVSNTNIGRWNRQCLRV